MRSHKTFVAYAPLNENPDYVELTRSMSSLISTSAKCADENKEMEDRSKKLAADIIKAIENYKVTRSPRYTQISNLFSVIDRDLNFEQLRSTLVAYHVDTSQSDISTNPLGLALWVYLYLNSSDYPVRFTKMSRMRSSIYAILEKEFSLSTLKSLTAHLDVLFSVKEIFINDLIIESIQLQSFANSLIFKIILLSQRVELISNLLNEITHAYVPPNVIREAGIPDDRLSQQLQNQLDEMHNQVDEIKNVVSTEITEHHLPTSEIDYKKKDARSKQLFANKTLRHTLANPFRKMTESKDAEDTSADTIELRPFKH